MMDTTRGYVEIVTGTVGKAGQRISVSREAPRAWDEAQSWAQRLVLARRRDSGMERYRIATDRMRATHVLDLTKVVHIIVYGGDL